MSTTSDDSWSGNLKKKKRAQEKQDSRFFSVSRLHLTLWFV